MTEQTQAKMNIESRKVELKASLRLNESSTEVIRRTLHFHRLFPRSECHTESRCIGCELLIEALEARRLRLVVDNTKAT